MKKNIYTLHSFENTHQKNSIYNFDVRAQLFFAIFYSIAVTLSKNFIAFLIASILPLCLLFFVSSSGLKTLAKLNLLNIVMILSMIFTFPSFHEAINIALLIILRMNFICIVFIKLFEFMAIHKIYYLPKIIPQKIIILFILTLRGIFILYDKLQSAILSVKLRAPDLHGLLKLKIFAYLIASSLLKSSFKSEKILLAINCRGGFSGFYQSKNLHWNFHDNIFCLFCTIYIFIIIIYS